MYTLKHHPSLTPERWATFPTEKQIFMIANESNRLLSALKNDQPEEDAKLCIERALELTDLTIAVQKGTLRYELARWREVFTALYLLSKADLHLATQEINALHRCLLSLNKNAAILL